MAWVVLARGVFLGLALMVTSPSAWADATSSSMLRTLFQNVVLKHEYEGRGGKPLIRWEVPVRLSVHFGASVDGADRKADMASITKVVHKIAGAARHPVSVTRAEGNFQLFVVSQDELRNLGPTLQQSAGLSAYAARAITRMPDSTNCLVVALPERNKSKGYFRAVAVVRAALSPAGRDSCFNEELAQGMGLPDDCRESPTIFNDNGAYSQLTEMDLAMLRLAYDRRLASGMSADDVMLTLDQILRPGS